MREPCKVYGCKNNGIDLLVPMEQSIRSQWIKAAKLNIGGTVRTYIYLCSDHFKGSDFHHKVGGKRSKTLKKKTIPSVFPWTVSQACKETKINIDPAPFNPDLTIHNYSKTKLPTQCGQAIPLLKVEVEVTQDPITEEFSNGEKSIKSENCYYFDTQSTNIKEKPDICIYSNINTNDGNMFIENRIQTIIAPKAPNSPAFRVNAYENNDKFIHFYSGLETYKKMHFVFSSLGDDVNRLTYFYGSPPISLDPLNQFFLTLRLLHRHTSLEELSMIYLISIKNVLNIVITWIQFMALQWKDIDLWLNRETVQTFILFDFNNKYPMTSVTEGATEYPIEKLSLPRAEQITFSTYKNKTIVKFLLGIAPSGLITYVSPGYGGSASDRQIIERSDLVNKLDMNNEIMVYKGMNVKNNFVSYGVKVKMSSFLKKQNHPSSETLKKNDELASHRIFIILFI